MPVLYVLATVLFALLVLLPASGGGRWCWCYGRCAQQRLPCMTHDNTHPGQIFKDQVLHSKKSARPESGGVGRSRLEPSEYAAAKSDSPEELTVPKSASPEKGGVGQISSGAVREGVVWLH